MEEELLKDLYENLSWEELAIFGLSGEIETDLKILEKYPKEVCW